MDQAIMDKTHFRIYGLGRGSVVTPKDFLDLASHETVRQILSRLANEAKIRRHLRELYEYPTFSTMLNAPANPDPDAIAQAIARARGWTIVLLRHMRLFYQAFANCDALRHELS